MVSWVINADTFMPIFSADTWFLSNRFIFLEEEIMHFSGHLSTGTDLVINFNLVKCITKINIIATQTIMKRWREDFHQKRKILSSARCTSMVYSTDTEVSFLMSCSLKVTQYMGQNTSQHLDVCPQGFVQVGSS